MKPSLTLLVLAGVIAAGGALVYRHRAWFFRPDFQQSGGTEVVFAIDPSDTRPFAMKDLCETLMRRIDPNGVAGVLVEGDGNTQVVVRVPNGSLHEDTVATAHALAPRQGRLEFLIVANSVDDPKAIQAAKAQLGKAGADAVRREKTNEPPPPPVDEAGKPTFPVELKPRSAHTYRWAELSKAQLQSLRFDSAALEEAKNAEQKKLVEDGLKSGEPFQVGPSLYFARPIAREARSKGDREPGRTRTFFVLLREEDKAKEVTGEYLTDASAGRDQTGRACIDFRFSPEGGERFHALTSRNGPTGGEAGPRRLLAILLDGQVLSAPAVLAPIRQAGQLTGEFTPGELTAIVRLLRTGSLPVRLKPEPVRISRVAPKN